jgi:hypothetical protein
MTSHNFFASRRLRTATFAVVAVAALALTGCNSGGEPNNGGSTSPSASESATPSATPTPTPAAAYKPADATGRAQNVPVPVLPEVAKTETKEGLEAFARYWYSTLSYAYETGDTKPLEAVSGPACGSCEKVKIEVTEWHTEGRWLAGGKLHVEGAHSDFVESGPAEYQAVVQVYQETIDYYLADSTLKGTLPRKPAVGDLVVAVFGSDGWKASTVEHLVK